MNADNIETIITLIKYLSLPMVVLLLWLFLLRPILKSFSSPSRPAPLSTNKASIPTSYKTSKLEKTVADKKKGPLFDEKFARWAKENPEEAKQMLKQWIEKK